MIEPAPETQPAPDARPPREFRLHPKVAVLWFLQAILFACTAALVGSIVLLVRGHYWWVPVVLVAALVWGGASILYGRAYIARFRATLLPDGLLVARGVWWRSEVFVPRARVQHTDVTQGPLARSFGMATLKVFTAGTQYSVIDVPDLAHASAITLRDTLVARESSDAL